MDPIRDLLHLYADAVCRRDREQWRATWTADAVWQLGDDRRSVGIDAIVQTWQAAMDRYPMVLHRYANSMATLDDATGTGHGRAYVDEIMRTTAGEVTAMHGYYDDEYRRTDEGWRFSHRTLVRLHHGPSGHRP